MRVKRLAAVETDRLFAALEKFVNMGDAFEDFRHFKQHWPDFFPGLFWKDTESGFRERSRGHPGIVDALDFRDYLRRIWRGQDDEGRFLRALLGFPTEPPADIRKQFDPERGEEVKVKHAWPGTFWRATILANWQTGELDYLARNRFQRALYLLCKESWRARTCARCSAYFIAQKPAQLYCSVVCSNEARRHRGGQWWKHHGKEWRKNHKRRDKKSRRAKTRRR